MSAHRDRSPQAGAAHRFESQHPGWRCEYHQGVYRAARHVAGHPVGLPLEGADLTQVSAAARYEDQTHENSLDAQLADLLHRGFDAGLLQPWNRGGARVPAQ